MAAGDSIVSICNIGLIELGEDPIAALTDRRKAAILANARYDQVRRSILRSAPWNCAKKQAQLAASTTPPAFTYANAYPTPADFIRMFDLPENDQAVWEVIGNTICTDEGSPLDTLYIFDLVDPTRFDPLLAESIGYAMGAALAVPLKQSKQARNDLLSIVEGKLAAARLAASQENSPKEWDVDVWLRQRA